MKVWILGGLLFALALVAPVQAKRTFTSLLTNAQGTVVAEMDVHGNVTYTAAYRPYGQQQTGTPQAGPGYTGHVNDPDTGLVYMQARYYDPSIGRFLSVDPVGPIAGNIFNFSRYSYTNNNPVNHIDPDGRCPDTDFGCGVMAESSGQHPDQMKPAIPFIIGTLAEATGVGELYGVVRLVKFIRRANSKTSEEATKNVKPRASSGADGGRSTITTEKDPKLGIRSLLRMRSKSMEKQYIHIRTTSECQVLRKPFQIS